MPESQAGRRWKRGLENTYRGDATDGDDGFGIIAQQEEKYTYTDSYMFFAELQRDFARIDAVDI